jgi:molybdate transport repressor ModE-like protein
MYIIPSVVWHLDGDPVETLDERLLPLLEAVATSRSLAAAVAQCGISYRAAWGLLREYRHKLGVALVLLERGRGASLTQAGERLLAAQRAATERLARILPELTTQIGPKSEQRTKAPALRLRVAASHDLALVALAELLPDAVGLSLELSFMGSLHALKAYSEGAADVAGFHVPVAGRATLDSKLFLKWLRSRRDRLIRFVDRDQGLILPRGNPQHVKDLRDIAARRLRFVNRQRGSGTRLLIDQIMADSKTSPMAIDGYRTEEFTHAAVAATVASGGADAGFGLRAAAAEYQLAFVPLVRERYFLAVRAKEVQSPAMLRFIAALAGPTLIRAARPLSGYQIAGAGSILNVDALALTVASDG